MVIKSGVTHLAAEALMLAGDKRADEAVKGSSDLPLRMQRAISKRLGKPLWPALEKALENPQLAVVRGALLEADAGQVTSQRAQVEALLTVPGQRHLALTASLALVRGGKTAHKALVINLLVGAIDDEIEGPDVRAALTDRLGEDLGRNTSGWRTLLQSRLQEVTK